MIRAFALCLVVACGGGSSPGNNDTTLVGECEPADDATELSVTPISLDADCLARDTTIATVESIAEWDALFAGCNRPEVPAGLDFATQRAAIASVSCQPIDFRFTSESDDEIVVGVMARVSGACIANMLVVPIERSDKPVRLAQCREDCPSCPPVP